MASNKTYKGKKASTVDRFGIGEWFGRSFESLSREERIQFAETAKHHRGKKALDSGPICPFVSDDMLTRKCNKAGGVCSLRLYTMVEASKDVSPAVGDRGRLRITCPRRFRQNGVVHAWVSEQVLGDPSSLVLGEIGFLESSAKAKVAESSPTYGQPSEKSPDDVGRIDNVLIRDAVDPLRWCALEIQAVYFQGAAMSEEFNAIISHNSASIPFPVGRRQPDYRSSGPKRLLPQLQVKVPTLRRWGKKMAVVVDEDFFDALGTMTQVEDISNCDVVWFVVGFDFDPNGASINPRHIHRVTLEDAITGLVAGKPKSLAAFEKLLLDKLSQQNPPPDAPSSAVSEIESLELDSE